MPNRGLRVEVEPSYYDGLDFNCTKEIAAEELMKLCPAILAGLCEVPEGVSKSMFGMEFSRVTEATFSLNEALKQKWFYPLTTFPQLMAKSNATYGVCSGDDVHYTLEKIENDREGLLKELQLIGGKKYDKKSRDEKLKKEKAGLPANFVFLLEGYNMLYDALKNCSLVQSRETSINEPVLYSKITKYWTDVYKMNLNPQTSKKIFGRSSLKKSLWGDIELFAKNMEYQATDKDGVYTVALRPTAHPKYTTEEIEKAREDAKENTATFDRLQQVKKQREEDHFNYNRGYPGLPAESRINKPREPDASGPNERKYSAPMERNQQTRNVNPYYQNDDMDQSELEEAVYTDDEDQERRSTTGRARTKPAPKSAFTRPVNTQRAEDEQRDVQHQQGRDHSSRYATNSHVAVQPNDDDDDYEPRPHNTGTSEEVVMRRNEWEDTNSVMGDDVIVDQYVQSNISQQSQQRTTVAYPPVQTQSNIPSRPPSTTYNTSNMRDRGNSSGTHNAVPPRLVSQPHTPAHSGTTTPVPYRSRGPSPTPSATGSVRVRGDPTLSQAPSRASSVYGSAPSHPVRAPSFGQSHQRRSAESISGRSGSSSCVSIGTQTKDIFAVVEECAPQLGFVPQGDIDTRRSSPSRGPPTPSPTVPSSSGDLPREVALTIANIIANYERSGHTLMLSKLSEILAYVYAFPMNPHVMFNQTWDSFIVENCSRYGVSMTSDSHGDYYLRRVVDNGPYVDFRAMMNL